MKNVRCDQLEEFFDGCLSAEERSEFEQHLESCPKCRSELPLMREVDSLICDAWSEIKLPSDMKFDVVLASKPTVLASPKRERAIAWASLACLAGAIFLTFLLTTPPTQNSDRVVTTQTESTEQAKRIKPVAFYESGDNGTLLSPVVSTSEFTIVNAFPTSTPTNLEPESIQ